MIDIVKTVNADSRSTDNKPSVEELRADTEKHIDHVKQGLEFIADQLRDRGDDHDKTKISMMEEFCAALNSGHIKETPWYQKHITEERHHLKSNVPDDVTLIDVIEHLVDCTMAGLARSGEVYDTDIHPDTLVLACQNTVELLKKNTVVKENDTSDGDLLDEPLDENFAGHVKSRSGKVN